MRVSAANRNQYQGSIQGLSKPMKFEERHMDLKLLDILVCPLCKSPLLYRKAENELICKADRLAFPIRDGIPVMLEDEARRLPVEEEI